MDYSFYTKDMGVVAPALLDPLVERVVELGQRPLAVARFNVRVNGLTLNQDAEVDKMVRQIKRAIPAIPDLGGNPWLPYFTVNWIDACSTLHEHTDLANGYSFDDLWTHKVHIPLVTDPSTMFGFRRNLNDELEWQHLKKGHVYVYNNSAFHVVTNPGPARAHLILYARDQKMIDYYKTTKVWDLYDTAKDPAVLD